MVPLHHFEFGISTVFESRFSGQSRLMSVMRKRNVNMEIGHFLVP